MTDLGTGWVAGTVAEFLGLSPTEWQEIGDSCDCRRYGKTSEGNANIPEGDDQWTTMTRSSGTIFNGVGLGIRGRK